jgi:hypothetical protein
MSLATLEIYGGMMPFGQTESWADVIDYWYYFLYSADFTQDKPLVTVLAYCNYLGACVGM